MGYCKKFLLILMVITPAVFFSLDSPSSCFGFTKRGEDRLVLWGSVRFRYEVQDNFNIRSYGEAPVAGESDDNFTLGRLRLGFRYSPVKNLILSAGIQHALVWGLAFKDEDFFNAKFNREHNPYKDKWEPYNTYMELRNILSQPLSIKAGRQLITYGDKRVFGPGQWGNSGKWLWDAVKAKYKWGQGFIDAYYGKTIIHDPGVVSISHRHGYDSVGFYGHFDIPVPGCAFIVEPFAMTKKDNHNRYRGEDGTPGDLDTYYVGARAFFSTQGGLDLDITYVTQNGDLASDDVDAYGYHVLAGYHARRLPLRPFFSTEYSYGSGDSDPLDGKHETFDAAFGARDTMYGRMNLFQWKNIKDAQVNLGLVPYSKVHIKLEYHKFWLAEKKDAWYLNPKAYRDKSGNSGGEVGREFDVVAKLDLPAGNQVQVGYGHFWPSGFAKRLASDDEANWIFVQWQIRFTKGIL